MRFTKHCCYPLTYALALLSIITTARAEVLPNTPPEWLAPHAPQRIYGNTFYVGSAGLSSILITSAQGHVLIDGALPEAAPLIKANIEKLGFRLQDIKLIVNSHVHYDHAGGIAQLQVWSGAPVAALTASAKILQQGFSDADDPQYGELPPIAPVKFVRVVGDGETVRAGSIALTAHATPGHTPGGTTWTWTSCDGAHCLNMVYADSLSAVAAKDFKFSAHPEVVAAFGSSFRAISALPCDILMTPHPQVSDLFVRLQAGTITAPGACEHYADAAQKKLEARLAEERSQ